MAHNDIEKHHSEFRRIIEKYSLASPEKSEEIAKFLTDKARQEISASEFAGLFAMDEHDAEVFLSFIEKGLNFKKMHIDQHSR